MRHTPSGNTDCGHIVRKGHNRRLFRIFYRVDKTLRDAVCNVPAQIVSLGAEQTLADRLRALGMGEGDSVTVLRAGRRVIYVRTPSTVAALGADLAARIGVRQ